MRETDNPATQAALTKGGPRRSGRHTPTARTVSLEAYKRNVGGAITIAVTGTDNPVPSQLTRATPPEPAPAVPAEAEKPAKDDTEPGGKSRKKKKA